MIYENYQRNDFHHDMDWHNAAPGRDKRVHERNIVRLKAVLKYKEMSYVGMIENISEHGVYLISLPLAHETDFMPGSLHEMKLRTQPGTSVVVHCKVQWSYRTPPYGLTHSVGMEILNPSEEFRKFLKTLV